ncbi:hypothetical protein FMUND_15314 [Fusarium mundagurra]|uniref:Zn(2)-C6 fungal-type domain-containing protein n=1 Tax=Fusarium mundagurra TaxID=1567541 RepID=A0A8H5XQP8_9HYPO|nr:hypothetical protein FMUND_15314 [Fusarium mundagurra]
MPCIYCAPRGLQCWAKDGHTYCSQCTRRGRKCDGKGVTYLKADRFVAEKRPLEREEEVTEAELLQLQKQLDECLNRLMLLRQQRWQFSKRGSEMLHRNVKTLDELEAVENTESFAAVEAQLLGASDIIDWGEVFSAEGSGGNSSVVAGYFWSFDSFWSAANFDVYRIGCWLE